MDPLTALAVWVLALVGIAVLVRAARNAGDRDWRNRNGVHQER